MVDTDYVALCTASTGLYLYVMEPDECWAEEHAGCGLREPISGYVSPVYVGLCALEHSGVESLSGSGERDGASQ